MKDDALTLVAQRIRHRRRALKMTQQTVATAIGLSRSNYANIEAGRITLSIPQLVKIANFFHTPLGYFIEDSPIYDLESNEILFYFKALPTHLRPTALALLHSLLEVSLSVPEDNE
jgi:transcriptional regulator with XRE-family HTH domain